MNEEAETSPSLHLEEVWKQRSASDQQSKAQLFLHHSHLAFLYLMKSPLMTILAVISVSTVLFILGLLIAVQRASFHGVSQAAGQLNMSVFVKDSSNDAERSSLESYVQKLPGFLSLRKLDKTAALQELRKLLPESPALLEGLDVDNPLPASLELSFDMNSGSALVEYANLIRVQPGVEAVAYDGQLVRLLSDLGNRLRGVGKFSSLILIGLTLFLIATTIRISLYHEREEIEIMGLVGAYHSFIQAPFIIGGALQGLCGFILAYLFLTLLQSNMLRVLQSDELFRFARMNFNVIDFASAASLAVLSIGAGILGSYLASRNFK